MGAAIDQDTDIRWPRFPYPGLRSFRITADGDESLIFRGRNSHRDDVLERLDTSQFVSVVGPSGCGKSSLVKVGIIPVLKAGLLTRAGYDWQAIEMQPGQDPLDNLATALAELNLPADRPCDGPPGMAKSEITALLATRRSALWMVVENLADRLQTRNDLARPKRVLLLLDQFEEIFSGIADPRAVDRFIALITQFFRNPHPQLFVVLTMRTDFISQCANFPGLAEILNRTQYITPVLRDRDLIEAIERPAETYWGEIEPDLVAAIVRDMRAGANYDADHLPLMQHALLWLWAHAWPATGLAKPPSPGMALPDGVPKVQLTLAEYEDHGRLHGILNCHADAIFTRITEGAGGDRRAAIIEAMFRRLSERDANGRYKRAPAHAREICRIAQCRMDELNEVVAPFARDDASFIELRPGHEPDNPRLDLSHESLIRQWERLRHWSDMEAEKVATFRKLAADAAAWARQGKSRSFLKFGGQLRVLQEWWHDNRPTEAWASRYSLTEGTSEPLADSLPLVEGFQAASVHRRRLFVTGGVFAVITLIVGLPAIVWGYYQLKLQADLHYHIASVVVLGNAELNRQRPDRALEIAREFLIRSPESGELSQIESLADRALQHLHERRVLRSGGWVYSLDYSPDGKFLLGSSSGRPLMWDVGRSNGDPLMGPDRISYWRTQWNPRGGQLLLTSQERTTILVPIDATGPKPDSRIRLGEPELGIGSKVGMGMFSGDGRRVATGGMGAPVRVWDADTGKLQAQQDPSAKGPEVFGLVTNVDASLVALPDIEGGVDIYNVDGASIAPPRFIALPRTIAPSGTAMPLLTTGMPCGAVGNNQVRALAFHPTDRRLLAFAAGCSVIAVDAQSGDELFQLRGNRTEINKVAFSADGTRIATGAEDGIVRVYDIPAHTAGARQPRRSVDQAVTLGAHDNAVYDVRFSPDGKSVASGGRDGTVRIWTIDPVLAGDTHFKRAELLDFAQQHLPVGADPLTPLELCLIGASECQTARASAEYAPR